jgi:hypothetical protein
MTAAAAAMHGTKDASAATYLSVYSERSRLTRAAKSFLRHQYLNWFFVHFAPGRFSPK